MNEDSLNMEIRKFLKKVGITSQRTIEQTIQKALAEGRLQGDETISLKMTLEIPELDVQNCIDGQINLE